MQDSDVIAGLDIGSDRIRVLLAEYDRQNQLVVSGWGESLSGGLRKGIVVNIEATREAVLEAVEAAQHEAGRTITELWTALGGEPVNGFNERGVVSVSGKNNEIGQADIDRVLEQAQTVAVPPDRDILHVLPQEYIADGQDGIRDPLDMISVRLEVKVHIVTAQISAVGNIRNAVKRAEYRVGDIALGSLAAVRSLLSEDEKEMGVLLIDVGASSTDYILIRGKAPRLSGSVPAGGRYFTTDLIHELGVSFEVAEDIKCKAGCCWPEMADGAQEIVFPGIGGAPVSTTQNEICGILQPRMKELLEIVQEQTGEETANIPGGVVLTGGGAQLPGCTGLASFVFGQPARVGIPGKSVGWPQVCQNPAWSTAAGLILLGDVNRDMEQKSKKSMYGESSGKFLGELKRWFGEFF